MMRRVDLLPQIFAERQKENRRLFGVVVLGVAGVVLLGGWLFMLRTQIGAAEEELAQVQARNDQLTAEIAELQHYALLQQELLDKQASLQTVMASDVDWPSLLTELAMVVPSDTWLTSVSGSAAGVEGETQVETETAPVRISQKEIFGRLKIEGSSLDMPGVAGWLLRLASVREFNAVFLNNASETITNEQAHITFDSTLELNKAAASKRYSRGMP